MAIPPDTSAFEREGEIELPEPCFVFAGDSIEYFKPFQVVDLSDGERPLRVRLEEDMRTVGAPDAIMPGSIHHSGTIRVHFEPATPGHRYRCDFAMGSRVGIYRPQSSP